MRLWSVPPLLLALLWAFSSAAALRAADEPGMVFFQVWNAYQDGAQLERNGKLDEALQKFRFCVSTLEQIQEKNPDYEPIVIDSRLKKSRAAIARVQSMQSLPATAAAANDYLTGADFSAPTPAPRSRRFDLDYQLPAPVAQAPPSPASTYPASPRNYTFSGDSVSSLKAQISELQLRLSEVNRLNAGLSQQLLKATADGLSAQKEVDLWKVRSVEQQSQLAQLRQSLGDLQEANERLTRENSFAQKRMADLQSDVEAKQADLDVLGEHNDELFSKLESAKTFIDADEKIRLGLLDDRKKLSAQLEEKTQAVEKAAKERDAAIAKNDALKKQIASAEKIEDANRSLSEKLADAEKQIARLSASKDERARVETDLRNQVDASEKSLAALREEMKAGRQRIAELEKQLSDTASASASAAGAMADENALLKTIIQRQLQDEAKRQQARKLVEEEVAKLQIRSDDLLRKLSDMAGAETQLTPGEKKLFDRPVVAAGSHSDFSFEVVKETPESDLPPELANRASEANKLAQNRQFAEARAIYQEIAEKAPKSYLAAINLGIAQRQLEDYPHAIAAFNRALELKSDDPFALLNLGTAKYRNGDVDGAVNTLQKAVKVDSESYLAHYLLGVALNDQGDRGGARRELQLSLDIKPDYVPARQLDNELRENSSEAPAPSATPQAPRVAQ